MPRLSHIIILTFLTMLALTACSPGSPTPALIGAYRPDSAPPLATYALPPADGLVAYNATLDLAVSDVVTAAGDAARVAVDYGGYLSNSQSWYAGDELHSALTLAVPSNQFDAVHTALLRLGTLNSDSVSSDLQPAGDYPWGDESTFTVYLSPAPPLFDPHWPTLPDTGWRPARTFAAAFNVFATLFTALVDAAIWLTVVAGPFALLALGLRRLYRPTPPVPPSPEEKKE